MSNQDFRLSVNFRSNHKVKKLEKRLRTEGVLSWISILAFAAESRPKGILHDVTIEDIEIKTGSKDAGLLVKTLLELKLLEQVEGVLIVHDWETHNPFAVDSPERSEAGRKAAQIRWKIHYKRPDGDAGRIDSHSEKHKTVERNAQNGSTRIGSSGSDHKTSLESVPVEEVQQ